MNDRDIHQDASLYENQYLSVKRAVAARKLGEQFAERLQIFFNLGQRCLVLLIGERKFELGFFFLPRFLQSLSGSLDGKTFRVEEPLDLKQQLDILFFVKPMS